MTSRTIMAVALAAALAACSQPEPEPEFDAEAIIIGAGISGLSAALEMGRAGVDVLLVDMNTVPGGHAVMAGGFAIIDTPTQQAAGFTDSPGRAYEDWQEWTEDGDPEWTRYYVENSRELIYDWAVELGADWVRVAVGGYENSVPRFHFSEHGAVDYVLALVRAALELPNVKFLWNQRVEHLTVDSGRVTGVEITNLRTGEMRTLRGEHMILATGGFEGDLERVLANWMPDLPEPDRLLVGASTHARGQGLDLASEVGAEIANLDRQYIYTNGTVNIRDPEGVFAITAGNDLSMWVNSSGERFTNEIGFDKTILVDLLNQDPTTYWAIFDEAGRDGISARGVEWINTPMDGHPLLDNPEITSKATTLTELAESIGIPADALASSVAHYNTMIDAGEDADFSRFVTAEDAPPRIEQPPFYAIQFFPMTRKSMGGVTIDMQGRALNDNGDAIPGLYAIGELTGSVGINGKHGMDGMFLGPAVLTGRIAGRTIAAAHANRDGMLELRAPAAEDPMPALDSWEPSLTATQLEALLATPRDGYWHFERSHELVLERQYQCTDCHSAEVPFFPVNNRASKLAQAELCSTCHGR